MASQRFVISLTAALLAVAAPLAAAEVYRTVDDNGVVIFTDVALPGAEAVVVDVPVPDPAAVAQARAEAERLIERADAQAAQRLENRQRAPVERETIVYREVVTQGGYPQRGFFPQPGFHPPHRPWRPHPPWRKGQDEFSDERPSFAPPGFAPPAFQPPQPVRPGPPAAVSGSAKGFGATP